MPYVDEDNAVVRSLSVRFVKGRAPRRAALTYPAAAVTDEEWMKLRDWLLGKNVELTQKKVLVINVLGQ